MAIGMNVLRPSLPANEGCSDAAVLARYRARYKAQDAIFGVFDRFLGAVVRPRAGQKVLEQPKAILLVNAGHLGDVIISTALFPVIKDAFPKASLGFLTGSYSRPVVEAHPLLDRTHFLDHWYQSRLGSNAFVRAWRYHRRDRLAMVRELKEAQYDVALDVRAWFPNLVPLLYHAEIPVRIGYTRVGFGPLLTHTLPYAYDRRHELEHQLDLLRFWGVPDKSLALAQPTLAPIPDEARRRVTTLMRGNGRYRVLHPASSTAVRDWTLQGWAALARNLLAEGVTPVLTGTGARDSAMTQAILQAAPGTVSTVGQLSWKELLALLAAAEAVYSVETSIGHAAAALGRPVIAIYGGMADPAHWAPLGSQVVTKPQACLPCFQKGGCSHRSCLLQITVEDVERAAQANNRRVPTIVAGLR